MEFVHFPISKINNIQCNWSIPFLRSKGGEASTQVSPTQQVIFIHWNLVIENKHPAV